MAKDLIMVVAHKMFDTSILPDAYRPIKVGSNLDSKKVEENGWLTDCAGENIADENPWYCELTAQYWVWKNWKYDDNSIIGLSHYRRYFFDYHNESKTWREDILRIDRAKEILSTHKIIMNYPTIKLPGKAYLYKNRSDEQQNKHWRIIKGIIECDYPEMIDVFDKYMYGRYTVWGNMFVVKGDVLREYSKWLFDVMKKYDLAIAELNEERVARVDGFLTEQLLLIWANYKFEKQEIYHLEVRNTEKDLFADYSLGGKGKVVHFIRCHRWMLNVVRYARIGVLLIKRSHVFGKET